ncbi:uncharacterized protein KY384_004266 [Bacidia gigantensis]|uniref:uncharacterized protein n=1 Tax=Bacidia gigantensis TaxID=2732470 RepID=UPI001D051E89|nr:uncharacterized protein KY384_004266 [Bacidia gigantensis]KAG8530909.1 hypothetical protein KY384_004266 [Bacidia gigantensis]
MHPTLLLSLLLPALTTADQAQQPLGEKAKGWFSAAKQYLPTAIPTVPGLTAIPNMPKPTLKSPISESAAKIAALKVHSLSMSNYRPLLTPSADKKGPTDWMTCGGHCHNLEVNWNETASILAADALAPKLGIINCDNERVLCAVWSAKPPTIWHIRRPAPAVGGETDVYINYLNFTTTTTSDMVALHTSNKYEGGILYEGMFHIFDGWLAQNGLLDYLGYVLYAFTAVPSWALMLTSDFNVSVLKFMGLNGFDDYYSQRRAGAQGREAARRPQGPQGAAPPANGR